MNTIGIRIRKLREEKNISQEKMAMELILTQSTYGRLEKNDQRLTAPKLIKIAQILNVSVSYLFGEQPELNFVNEKKNTFESNSVIIADKEHIKTLKEEVIFLRKLVEEFNKEVKK